MAPVAWDEVVFTHDKKAKEKVRKCGTSAKRKALQLGKSARVFSAVIHFNPTYGELDGAVFVPEDEEIPDVNQFLAELANGTHQIGGQRRVTRRRQKKTEAEPSQITEETSRIKVVEVASSVKEEPETVAAEDAAANEITSEDTDAPHEIEADNHGVGTFGGATPGAQQDEAPSDEDPISSADQGLLTGTAKFDQNVSGVGDSVMGGNDTASAINASEEDSFVGLLEIGLHDLLEMEADGACAPAAGPVDASKLSILEEWSSNIIPDRERFDSPESKETSKLDKFTKPG
ncbi:hypothetical protein LZ30DRAFT_693710 [Colletotrichum cereale]|nr:hypothetical protein LZ30DRAFT_693710 [Colletotrichum cereale]